MLNKISESESKPTVYYEQQHNNEYGLLLECIEIILHMYIALVYIIIIELQYIITGREP